MEKLTDLTLGITVKRCSECEEKIRQGKVFVVTSGCYSDYHISRIFATREAAELFCAVTKWDDDPNIEEWDLEDTVETVIETVHKAIYFNAGSKADRVVYWEMKYGIRPYELDIQSERTEGPWHVRGVSGYIPVNETITDDEKAHKIIFDHLAKWKAEQAGL